MVIKWLIGIGISLLLTLGVLAIIFWQRIQEIRGAIKYGSLFETEKLFENFRTWCKQYPNTNLNHNDQIYQLPNHYRELPETYVYEGKNIKVSEWIKRTDTTGIIVIKDGNVVFENYYHGNNKLSHAIVFSVSKSFVSFLIGVALEEGKIESLHDPVDKYVPDLKGSGYEGVSIKNVLQMSSGIKFTEDYHDLKSDIARLAAAVSVGSLDKFIASLKNERTPGSYNKYVSADTQVLSMVLKEATNKSLTDYMQEKLWSQLGAEHNAEWLTDKYGTEMALGGLNVTIRDLARFGLLYLNKGQNFKGEQLVSSDWIEASVTPDAPHLMPGRDNPNSEWILGYGYQWWIPEIPEGDYAAIGIYGQFIYVHPEFNVVIAKTSAYADYENTWEEMELESLHVFRSIAKGL